jgi:hypothetical protein
MVCFKIAAVCASNLNPIRFTAPYWSLWLSFRRNHHVASKPQSFTFSVSTVEVCVCAPVFVFVHSDHWANFIPRPWTYWKGKYHIYQRFLTFQICTSNCNGGGDILSLKKRVLQASSVCFSSYIPRSKASFFRLLSCHSHCHLRKDFHSKSEDIFSMDQVKLSVRKGLPVLLHDFDPCCSSLQLTLTSFLIS